MATTISVPEPIAISFISGRYLLFDVDVVTHLRRTYNICGVLTGTIPQIPQQNLFLGLPVELLPEEARLLVEKQVAYIVDDTRWHSQRYSTLEGSDRKKYLESLRSEGFKAKRASEIEARKKTENALAKKALKSNAGSISKTSQGETPQGDIDSKKSTSNEDEALYDDVRPASRSSSATVASTSPWGVTPTISYTPSSLPECSSEHSIPPVPSSYPLFAHLHSRDYFITPGLRFGCDYTVYPGDPLRFHSHFVATGYGWNEGIRMLDIVGGGRLGTGVKKGFLMGGEDPEKKSMDDHNSVRTFCIEWGGM